MDSRRATRAGPPPEPPKPATRRVGTRSSPARVSPVRKSPARRSPARKSPARKSPARRVEQKSPVRKRSPSPPPPKRKGRPPRKASPSPVKKNEVSPTVKVSLATLSNDSIRSATSRSAVTTKSTVTTSTTRVKVSNLPDGHNINLDRVTSDYVDSARTKLAMGLSHELTPTPSELSKQSVHSHSVSRSFIDEDDRRSEEYSDTEKEPLYESFKKDDKYLYGSTAYSQRNTAKQLVLQEFGGTIGAIFWIILIPVLGFYMQFVCNRQDCTGTLERLVKLQEWGTYFNLEAGYLYFGYTWALFLLSAFPLGRIVRIQSDRGPLEYVFNGIGSAIIAVAVVGGAEYLKYPAMKMVYRNYQQLCFISILYALIIAGWCYLRSKYVPTFQWNSYAKSGRFFADYFIGREINPRWFQVIDIKLVHYRIALISTLIINSIFAYKTLKFAALPTVDGNVTLTVREVLEFAYTNVKYDTTSLVISSLLIIYVLDLLWYEHHLTSSFELHGEGVGAMLLLRYSLYPFVISLISKYVFEHKSIDVPLWANALTAVIFLVGVLVKRRSNKIKYEYRMQPNHIKFSALDTLPTFQGRRLIVSSYWGALRNPNYLGDIISHLALLIPLIWKFAWPPLVAILLIIVLLVHRTRRVDNRNFTRYNSAWTRYCTRVKYMLVPRIY